MGLNAALAMSGRALEVFTAGIHVAGQNVANANTPGYIREELIRVPNLPYPSGGQILGSGVLADGVVQQIDLFLEARVHSANTDFSAASALDKIYKQLEAEIRELGDTDLSTSLSNFLATLNDVANQPESAALRQIAVGEGVNFARDIGSLRVRIDELRNTQTVAIDSLVAEANDHIQTIHALSPKIARLEAGGFGRSEAGALRSQRYAALNRLSEIVPIQYRERKDGRVDVYSGSDYLILGSSFQTLETFPTADRGVQVQSVQLSKTKSVISANAAGGELRGIIDGRDNVLGGFVDTLDSFASNLIFEFNKIHTQGQGIADFATLTSDNEVLDSTAVLNSSAAALPFTPQHGSFQLKVTNTISGLTDTTTIAIDLDGIGTDTTLTSLAADITAVSDVTATITATGRLRIDAGANFEFSFGEDSSNALAALGINSFFTGFDSTNIGVNSVVANDSRYLATGQGGGPADGRNAVQLAEFHDQSVAALGDVSIDEFYENSIAGVAQASASEGTIAAGFESFRESLQNQREQFSGVSVDEETIKIMEFQHSFQAAARMISTIDELFTVLLTM